jgi:hypothetical protein
MLQYQMRRETGYRVTDVAAIWAIKRRIKQVLSEAG